MSGYGQLFYANGKPAYEGFWTNNKFNGEGKVFNDIPDTTQENIELDYNDLSQIEEKWISYEG